LTSSVSSIELQRASKKAGRIDKIREALCARDRSSCLVNLFVELGTDALACDDSAIRRSTSSRTRIRFSSLKNEIVHHRNYQTRDEARTEIFEHIKLFYNRKRLHQSLNYQTPMNYKPEKVLPN